MEQQAETETTPGVAAARPVDTEEEMEMIDRSRQRGGATVDCDGGVRDPENVSAPLAFPGTQKRGNYLSRLRDRKLLLEEKKFLCSAALCMGVLGILLMIIHSEICRLSFQPGSNAAFILNCFISLSTACLLISLAVFHYKDVRLFIIDHNYIDWRIAMTGRRVLLFILELLVCSIHPVGTYWSLHLPTNSSSPALPCVSEDHGVALMDLERLACILMFLRLYLVHRVMLLHSKVLLSASYRSVGSLNSIKFTFRLVLKMMLNKYPTRMLMVFIMFFWITASWMLTLCERHTHESTAHMGTAMWLIAITFLTVGYGDVSPYTSCGKVVCLFAGLLGVACTAMLVAVVAKKLALNKGEEYVHYFMMNIQTTKRLRHAAANVLRECWLLHRTTLKSRSRREHRRRQRCFLDAIIAFRHLRLHQKQLRHDSSEMVDLPKLHQIMTDLSNNWNSWCQKVEVRLRILEEKVDNLNRAFEITSELLCQVLDPPNRENR
ncbi:intermediate conductance calcium-activated potassium channel protein 4 [Genypterus blacodes]|uniref:intermediate conductance calcium-activated potassium channel protein 4 n=1 Tax=Genypterus blacodes TaxID=154954 RepID=UPI003F75AA91